MKQFVAKFDSLASFLILECLGLVAFALGGINEIFYFVGVALSLLSLPFFLVNKQKLSKQDKIILIGLLLSIVLIAGFTSFGRLFRGASIISNIGAFLAIPSFFLLGLSARKMTSFKIDLVLLVIGGAIALLTFISLIYTRVRYGFFYVARFQETPTYYYYGSMYDITLESGWLVGFSFKEVSLNYSGLFGVILCSCFSGLLFVSPKQDKRKFIITCLIGFIGLLSIISSPNYDALFYLIPIVVIAFLYRFLPRNKKLLSFISFFVLGVLIVAFIALILVFLNASRCEPIFSWFKNVGFLNRLFNENRIIMPINKVIYSATSTINFFGFNVGDPFAYIALYEETHAFEFEILKEGGIFAFVSSLMLILITIFACIRYAKQGEDKKFTKMIIISFLSIFFLYNSFSLSSLPIVHSNGFYSSFFRSLPTLVALFFIGYIALPKNAIVTESAKEENKTKEKKTYKDEYSFDEPTSEVKEKKESFEEVNI